MGKLNKLEIDSYLRKYRVTEDDIDFINNLPQKDINFDLNFLINSIYFTSNIEYENSLTIEKTRIVVKEFIKNGRRIINNNSKEYTTQLIENAINFYMYIEELLSNNKLTTIKDITNLHFLLMQGILNEEECGVYRNFKATI